jgi:hypothetical protein
MIEIKLSFKIKGMKSVSALNEQQQHQHQEKEK